MSNPNPEYRPDRAAAFMASPGPAERLYRARKLYTEYTLTKDLIRTKLNRVWATVLDEVWAAIGDALGV